MYQYLPLLSGLDGAPCVRFAYETPLQGFSSRRQNRVRFCRAALPELKKHKYVGCWQVDELVLSLHSVYFTLLKYF